MPFYPPTWVPELPFDPPSNVSIPDFMLSEEYGRYPMARSKPPFICGLSGREYTPFEAKERVEHLALGMAQEFSWEVNQGTEWDKVVAVFALNTIDTLILNWAIHRLGGISTPANAAYSPPELEHQLRSSGAKHVFTCLPLLQTTIVSCAKLGIPQSNIHILELPREATNGAASPAGFKTVQDFVNIGRMSGKTLAPLQLGLDGGAKRVAFLCYSSGTSGLPKGVMISHRNVITNTLQMTTFESVHRNKHPERYPETALGLLPFNHIYALVIVCHVSAYRGDAIIVLPRFEFHKFIQAIEKYQINNLCVVPPIIIQMLNNAPALRRHNLSHVRSIYTGAAPLGATTASKLLSMYPNWTIRQAYGLTETCTVIATTSYHDVSLGSVGSLVPGYEVKLVSADGTEITGYDQPGEICAKSPSVVLGYLNNAQATAETFVDGYMRTGDEGMFRRSANGHEHLHIVDRIKELIKVKGMQVAPAELEAHLLTHEAVADAAVVPVPDEEAGERPKAFVVLKGGGALEESPQLVKRDIMRHVEREMARHKWVREVEFVDAIPKSPSGKILRRLLREKDREARRRAGARM